MLVSVTGKANVYVSGNDSVTLPFACCVQVIGSAGGVVGGGVVFGPKPRDYSYTLPKKVRKKGLAMAVADRAREGKLLLVEAFAGVNGKTKEFLAWAKEAGLDGSESVLLVTGNELVRRAARNLPWVVTLAPEGLNVYDIVRTERLVMDLDAWEVFQNRIGGEA